MKNGNGNIMTVLSCQSIRELGVFTPFNERKVFNGMSYGLSYSGYDVRIAEDVNLSASLYGPLSVLKCQMIA